MAVELLKVHGLIKMAPSKILPNVCIDNTTLYNQPFVILERFSSHHGCVDWYCSYIFYFYFCKNYFSYINYYIIITIICNLLLIF